MNDLDLGEFKYIGNTHRNSKQITWQYELDNDWLEIIDTCDSMDEHYVIQFYKECELVDTKIMYCNFLTNEEFENEIKKMIEVIYGCNN